MSDFKATMAKLAGISKALDAVLHENVGRGTQPQYRQERKSFPPYLVQHYFEQTAQHVETLKGISPALFGDFQRIYAKPLAKMAIETAGEEPKMHYARSQVEGLIRDINQLFEIRANSELEQPKVEAQRRVFITHGNTDEWRKVQPFIEKDVKLATMELAQEYNGGQTIIEKLFANGDKCDSAVIVMTGDDVGGDGKPHARENVMHEIGFFQGRYGRGRVIVLHEEGVNIPSNLFGVIYSAFPKGTVEACFHLLQRELTHIYKL
jgi:predicted nucleotide-binding protein